MLLLPLSLVAAPSILPPERAPLRAGHRVHQDLDARGPQARGRRLEHEHARLAVGLEDGGAQAVERVAVVALVGLVAGRITNCMDDLYGL